MSLIKDLLERPFDQAITSKYTAMNGLVYLGAGTLVLIWPGMVQTIFRDAAFEAIIARELPETPRKSSIHPPSGHHKTGAIIDDPFSGVKFYADAEEVLAKLPAGNNGPSRV